MGFTGTLLGGALGWAFGGPLGALVGGLVGRNIDEAARRAGGSSRPPAGASAAVSLAVLMAAVTRADARTTKGEVQYVKEFLVRNFGRENAADLMQVYRRALEMNVDLDRICDQIREVLDRPSRRELLYVLFGLAATDRITPEETGLVRDAGRRLGIGEEEIGRIEAMFGRNADRAYDVLGASRDDTPDEVKRKYRELAKKYHPDRVAHLGEEFRVLAKKKFQAIQEAYETIERERSA